MHVLAQLQLPDNMMYLDAFGCLMDFQEGDTAVVTVPAYMAGDVVLPQLLDCLLCQVGSTSHPDMAWILLFSLVSATYLGVLRKHWLVGSIALRSVFLSLCLLA
jgi:hypothetical protein